VAWKRRDSVRQKQTAWVKNKRQWNSSYYIQDTRKPERKGRGEEGGGLRKNKYWTTIGCERICGWEVGIDFSIRAQVK
jgi:hypothetical protein